MNELPLIDATFICMLALLAYSDLRFLQNFNRPISPRYLIGLVSLTGLALSQWAISLNIAELYLLGTGIAVLSYLKPRRNQLLSQSHLITQGVTLTISYTMFALAIPPDLFLLAIAGLAFLKHRLSFLRESSNLHSDFIELQKKLLTQRAAQIFPDEIQAKNR